MEIKRFALGMRFDFLKDKYTEEDVSFILHEITSVLSVSDTAGLCFFGGTGKIKEDDSEGVYTVVFTNGDMMRTRNVYHKLNEDAVLRSWSDHRVPFLQNNVIRSFNGLEFYGKVGEDGKVEGGSGRDISFSVEVKERAKFTGKDSILIAPNSFKGTISSDAAAARLLNAMRAEMPERNAVLVPVADGGDGTLSAVENSMLAFRRGMDVTAPSGGKIRAEYLVTDCENAIIESALASGLALCAGSELDPLNATSCGTGELMLRAAHEGMQNIYVCLGGSATNDCGIGLLRALGVKFIKNDGSEAVSAKEMGEIVSIDGAGIDPFIKKARIYAVCDVKNPLTGANGATRTYGPQKGVTEESFDILERGMLNMERLLNAYAGRKVCSEPGAGAAGGMGAALMALLGAEHIDGAEAVLQIAEFDEKLRNAALVITGEGRIDASTMEGKAVGTVIKHAEKAKVPVALIAGSLGEGSESVLRSAKLYELTGSEEDALRHFDAAAERLAERIKKL